MHRFLVLPLLSLASTALAQAPPPANFPGTPPPAPPALIRDLSADPAAIEAGQATTLRWEALNAYSLALEPGVGTVATRGSQRVTPAATTTYTLTAMGSGGPTTRAVTVTVAGTVPTARLRRRAMHRERRPCPASPTASRTCRASTSPSAICGSSASVTLVPGAESFRVAAQERDVGTGADCLPPGVPAATMLPFPLQIVHTQDVLAILYEAYHQFRIVPVGREHAEYLAPAWMGHSVAHWDGDTLVVDVRGFNDRTVIAGHGHTEELRVTERYRRTAYETIEYEAIVEDPNVFAAPLRYAGTLTLHPEWEIGEYVCAENNQDYDELFEED